MTDQFGASSEKNMKTFEGKILRNTYKLEKLVGEGAFGGVFRSEQQFLGLPVRKVAIKLTKQTGIDTSTARDIFTDAFLLAQAMDEMTDDEARSHLVQIYDLGILPEEGNRGYIVMEYVKGQTLQEVFRSFQQVPANQLLTWAKQICCTLRGLHALKEPVLHRDLKPDNILLGADDRIRVIDFGLAAKMVRHGFVSGVAGTLDYMSPETTQGKSVLASDVYSIGLILYEGLSGRHPFAHLIPPTGMPEVLHNGWLYQQKQRVFPDPPSRWNNSVLRELDALVLRCLAFDPAKRYYDANILLKAIYAIEEIGSSSVPSDVVSLKQGQELRKKNDLSGARRAFQLGLAEPSSSRETRFALLWGSGEVLSMLGELTGSVERLVEAWRLTENTTILREKTRRAELLGQVADAYRRLGNTFQAKRYEELRKKELS